MYNNSGEVPVTVASKSLVKKITAMFGRQGGYLFALFFNNDITVIIKVAISTRSRQVIYSTISPPPYVLRKANKMM